MGMGGFYLEKKRRQRWRFASRSVIPAKAGIQWNMRATRSKQVMRAGHQHPAESRLSPE